jgi:glycosyltransferase involved in cell wall biosynthesis
VTDGSDIMIADDPKIFAEAIIKLLENQAFFANIGKNARSFIAQKMDENKISAELLTFYQDNLK